MKKTEQKNPEITCFTEKYESRNPISNWLIARFYSQVKRLIPDNVTRVLEVGCGAGYSTRILKEFFPKSVNYSASDISAELLNLARTRVPGIQFEQHSIYDLPNADNSVDLVICLETLEHLDRPEAALKEIYRVTRKHAIFSVPREPLWRTLNIARGKYIPNLGNTPGHINHWSRNSFKRFLAKHFKIVDTATPIPWTIVLSKKN